MHKKISLGFICILVAGSVIAAPPQPAPKPTTNVNVVNQPTVDIGNQPTVTVGNSVTVANDPLIPLTVEDPYPRTPIVLPHFTVSIPSGSPWSTREVIYTVPADKRLVIESVSMRASAESGGYSSAEIDTLVNGVAAYLYVGPKDSNPPAAPTDNSIRHNVVEQVRWYADPGTDLGVRLLRDGSAADIAALGVSISGYLISVDSPNLGP